MKRIPFLRPSPPRLSALRGDLEAIESAGIYSNYGPVSGKFESAATAMLFAGRGDCLTVANATLGLMIAIRDAASHRAGARYALMPSFTFAAAAHAAIWAGLTPLLCDIQPESWTPDARAEDELLAQYADQIACVVPYATFGNGLDLDRYARIAREHDLGVVIDAAASLGSLDQDGLGFGSGFPHAVVFSMHATKAFATSEAGLIHCGDAQRVERLRAMGNFGFTQPRTATMPGLNAKLSEVGALLALVRLEGYEEVVRHRLELAASYRELLPGLAFQRPTGARIAHQFMPALLPPGWGPRRERLIASLEERGVAARHYFSPHLAEQPYFQATCVAGDLTVTQEIAPRILSLPMADEMDSAEVAYVCAVLSSVMEEARVKDRR